MKYKQAKGWRKTAPFNFGSVLRVLLGLGVFLGPSPGLSSEGFYLTSVLEDAKSQQLWKKRQWRKLLFIPDGWLARDRSLVDDPKFFNAKGGKSSPKEELLGTLRAFFADVPEHAEDKDPKHARCIFPARFEWLKDQLRLDESRMPTVPCPQRDAFLNYLEYERVSLVFSNYFLNNPASMFGHTFFRLHRPKDKQAISDDGLLDDILNFSAFVPPKTNALAYAVMGLTGGFWGKFSLVPYYHKIQEYSNSESRDLWEYELALSLEQVRKFELILWEIGNIHINYYYLDENCSYVLLSVLEAVDPTAELTGGFNVYAIPADTLRAVTKLPGRIKKISYRPSIMSRYLSRASVLNKREIDILGEVLEEDSDQLNTSLLASYSSASQAKITDAALDFIDFKERLFADEKPEFYPKLRRALLRHRSQIPDKPLASDYQVEHQRPDFGHGSSRVGLRGSYSIGRSGGSSINFRPALHDIRGRSRGYANEMQISFLDTWLGYDFFNQDLFLEELRFLEILSLAGSVPLVSSLAWHVNLGYETYLNCAEDKERCHRYYLQVGFGKSAHLIPSRLLLFALLHGDMGLSNEAGQSAHIGPAILGGILIEMTDWLKLTSTVQYGKYFGGKTRDKLRHKTTVSLFLSQSWETRLFVESNMAGQRRLTNGLGLELFSYF